MYKESRASDLICGEMKAPDIGSTKCYEQIEKLDWNLNLSLPAVGVCKR